MPVSSNARLGIEFDAYGLTAYNWRRVEAGLQGFCTLEAAPNMIFFIHIILADSDTQRAMTLGQTVRVTQSGCERLSRLPLELVVQ